MGAMNTDRAVRERYSLGRRMPVGESLTLETAIRTVLGRDRSTVPVVEYKPLFDVWQRLAFGREKNIAV